MVANVDPNEILVTGGCGFIGSHLVPLLLETFPQTRIVNLDLCTYAGPPENLQSVADHPRYRFVKGDVADPEAVALSLGGRPRWVVHGAAESHVDRSIVDPGPFLRTNVLGTEVLLRGCREVGVEKVLVVSTDEVYGSVPPDAPGAEPGDPLCPSSPYAASKAGGDLLALAHHRTYRLPVLISRCVNNYGPRQFPEKFLPVALGEAVRGREIPLYGDGLHQRDWLHVADHCRGLLAALLHGEAGRVYHFAHGRPRTNREVAELLLEEMRMPPGRWRSVPDRLGHDRRYFLNDEATRKALNWAPQVTFQEGLAQTVAWYRGHQDWCTRVLKRAEGMKV